MVGGAFNASSSTSLSSESSRDAIDRDSSYGFVGWADAGPLVTMEAARRAEVLAKWEAEQAEQGKGSPAAWERAEVLLELLVETMHAKLGRPLHRSLSLDVRNPRVAAAVRVRRGEHRRHCY